MINIPTTVNHPVWLDWYNIDISSKYSETCIIIVQLGVWHSIVGVVRHLSGGVVTVSPAHTPPPPSPPYPHLRPLSSTCKPISSYCRLFSGTTATTRGVGHLTHLPQLPHTYYIPTTPHTPHSPSHPGVKRTHSLTWSTIL